MKKKEEPKDQALIDVVLSWSIAHIMKQNLYKDKVNKIPDTFSSVQHYLHSFINPLIEETHADLRSSLSSLRSAPAREIVHVRACKPIDPKKNIVYFLTLKNGDKKAHRMYEPECGDLVAITDVMPKCVDDLNEGLNRPFTLAYVQGMKGEGSMKIPIQSSKPIAFREGPDDRLFAVYLTNLCTNRRIWNALHPGEGGNTTIINSVLDVKKPSMVEKCTICYADETKTANLKKLREALRSSGLNDSQRAAVLDGIAFAECRHQNGVRLLWGPPGTGKTNTIATLGRVLLQMRRRALACAPTNVAVLGLTERLVSSLSGTLVHGTYGLGDVLLFGNGKRMKIEEHEDLHDVFLDYRVEVLARCFAPLSGWRGNLDKMTGLLEDPQGQYQLYLSGLQKNEDNSDQSDGDDNEEEEMLKNNIWKKIINQNIKGNKNNDKNRIVPMSFEKFVAETFRYVREELIVCLTGLYTHMPTSFVPLDTLENMIKVVNLLDHWLVKEAINGEESGRMTISQTVTLRRIRLQCLQAMHYLRMNFSVPQFTQSLEIKNFCLQNACLIFCTVSGSSRLHTQGMKPFEMAIIDEAAQLKECETNIPLQLNGLQHAILVGDEKQLPAMVISKISERAGFGRSLFERLVKLGHHKHLLNIQYRMHPSISSFPNKEFYGKRIKDGWNVTEKSYEKRLLEGKLFGPYSFINVTHGKEELDSKQSWKNIVEASVVAEIVSRLSKQCKKSGERLRVGCLSPYKGQVAAIEDSLGKTYSTDSKETFSVNVRSVDGFQGGEEDVIIMSTVRCNGNGSVGFLDNRNRTNVALTRAKYCLWIIGNGATLLNSGSVWRKLVMNAKDRGCFFNAQDDTNLSLSVSNSLVEFRQLSSLFTTDSVLFKEAKWKICFSKEFNNSIMRFPDIGIVNDVISLVVKISNGWRQQQEKAEGDTCQLLEWCDINGELRLIWTVDVIRVKAIDTQVIRVLDIIPKSKTSEMVKSFVIVVGNYTVNRMNRCLCKLTEWSLSVPVTWPIDELATRLESISLKDERPRSRSRRYGRKAVMKITVYPRECENPFNDNREFGIALCDVVTGEAEVIDDFILGHLVDSAHDFVGSFASIEGFKPIEDAENFRVFWPYPSVSRTNGKFEKRF